MPHRLAAEIEDDQPRSQASYAYEMIRRDILAGRYQPDQKLKIQDLSGALDVSPGAVREALSRLVPEQLVTSRDQRGFAVAPLSVEDLQDLTDLRCDVETLAIRRSLTHAGIEWEARLIAAAHRLRQTPTQVEGETPSLNANWMVAHAGFHRALVAAAGSRRLLALHAQLYEQSERYRGLSAYIENRRDVAGEHQQILDRALARDIDGTIKLILEHIRETTRLIIANIAAGSTG